ncbi:helix-turn-helix transcriptional regulator [Frankia sp. CNm7]|uniref:winged helix-turn-helix transcriptional regulator n=1 Tax=Frankia nepalensis TaxID=1836974 RepID=UPI001932A112|nr:helix-turn-helix domain-containing protein [Frankia nepalensis]MBL7517920.1 helix-turn-helix transcriptional regulator [Frankia nepalensis]
MMLVIPDVLEASCATRQALERLAAKWRVLLVYALLAGPQRHADLRRRLPDITQKVLTETLRGMQADGLVEGGGGGGAAPPPPPPPLVLGVTRSA